MSNLLYWRLSRPLYTYLSVRFVCYRPLAPMIRYFHEDKTEEFKKRLRQRMKKNAELKDDAAKARQKAATPATIAESASLSKLNETKPSTSININENSPNLYGVECPIQPNADPDCSAVSSSSISNPSQDKDIESSVETFEIRAKAFVESAKHKEKESERPADEQASKNSPIKKPKFSPSTSTPIDLKSADSPKKDSHDPMKEKSKSFPLFRPETENESSDLKISAKAEKTLESQKDFKSYGLNESIKIEPFNSSQSVSHDSVEQKGESSNLSNLSRTQVNKETDITSTKAEKTLESLKDFRSEGGKDSFKMKSQVPWEGMFDHHTDRYISKTKLRKESNEKTVSSKGERSKHMSMDGPKGQSKIEENRIEQLSQAEAEAEARAEVKAKLITQTKAEAKVEAKAEAEVEAEAETDEEMKVEPKAEAKAKAEAEAEAKLKAKEEAKAKAEAKAIADAEARAKAKAIADAEARAKAKAKAEARAIANAEAIAKAKAKAEARAIADAEARAKAEAKAKAEEKAKAEAKIKAEAKAKAE
ncbi:uncharacterized protein Dmoj_GI27056, partial [Drosophila mojavensis]